MATNRILPGSFPQTATNSALPVTDKDLYSRTCIDFLEELAIDPGAFTLKVRSIFRANVEEGWRRIGEEMIRKSTPTPTAILNDLNLPLKYLDRFKREIGLSYIFSWGLRRNVPISEVFNANPRSIAVFASAATASTIQHLIQSLRQPDGQSMNWEKRLLSYKYEIQTGPKDQAISPGDYCLLFRVMMCRDWANVSRRIPKTLSPIAQQLVEEHHREDFYLRLGTLSDIEDLDGIMTLLRDWNTAVSLLIWTRPLNMEFQND